MANSVLEALMTGNEHYVEHLDSDHFEGVRDVQKPPVVSVGCADSRVPVGALWATDEAGKLFKSVNIANQAWTTIDGRLVVNDVVGYAVAELGVSDIVILGHTGCGGVTSAYESVVGDGSKDLPVAVEEAVSRLVPLVEEARELGLFDEETPTKDAVNRLVEYAVVRQVEFLTESDEVPETTDCWGFVYDFQHVYGDDDGAAYLVAANGDSDPDLVAEWVPDEFAGRVKSIR
ncbi:carbonic anhydrase [Haloferax sp. MBLA0076]|uniref:carbonic anhydrase n=1 Tax=Haloferax litoreum TaxID=2666140 RepID=A0A6A8GD11_9EURY|nr:MULTISPECIES: carbonic anhydrase [Haloferax]KAB1191994.1 carbonic anhydrase [Haloferax sp. CBA1148]MRX20432.1 carbonic anhydrase [Haloferax litoreum]